MPRSLVTGGLVVLAVVLSALIVETREIGALWFPVMILVVALVVELWTRRIIK